MLNEEVIIEKWREYRKLIGRDVTKPATKRDITYGHFKAGYMMANFMDLSSRGFSESCWNGDDLENAVSGEDLL